MYRFGRASSTMYLGLFTLAYTLFQPSLAIASTYGAGNNTCANWVEITETGNDRSREEEWLLGYISGISSHDTVGGTDPDELIAGVDSYCTSNPRNTIVQAARSLVLPPGIAVAGVGNSEGELLNQAEMNAICRSSYPNHALGFYPVRWATTTDFREYSTAKGWNQEMVEVEEDFALRAENTVITSDRVAYDQATGAISNAGGSKFPGAVVSTASGAYFRHKRFRAKPLCVWGRPNGDLR